MDETEREAGTERQKESMKSQRGGEERQKDWNRKREGVAEKRERWKGCCHSPAASPDNPSSLHMIISQTANEPLLHIWNTNNLTLNQKWQARLVIGRGLLLAATEHQQRLILTESFLCSLSGGNAFRTEWKTSTCQYFECWNHSLSKNLLLWSVPDFSTQTVVSQFVLILHTASLELWWSSDTIGVMTCIIMKTHSKFVIPVAEILTVWILCVLHHAWIFCWKQRKKINCEMIKKHSCYWETEWLWVWVNEGGC